MEVSIIIYPWNKIRLNDYVNIEYFVINLLGLYIELKYFTNAE